MNFKEDCRKIIEHILKQVTKSGSFGSGLRTTYDSLAKELGLENGNYCKACAQYLVHKHCLTVEKTGDGMIDLSISIDAVDLL